MRAQVTGALRGARGAWGVRGVRGARPWLARGILAATSLGALGLGLIVLVLHIDPLDECTVLRTRTSPGIVTNIGSQPPGWDVSGPPAISIDVGSANQSYQLIRAFRFHGPIKPLITSNASARALAQAANTKAAGRAGQQLQQCARDWSTQRTREVALAQGITWAALALICATLAVSGIGHYATRHFWLAFLGACVASSAVTAALWGVSLRLAVSGTETMVSRVNSLDDLISYAKTRTSPPPLGPPQEGYAFVSLGDSEFSLLGGRPPETYASADDETCARSTDSLAAVLASLTGRRTLNLACPGATIPAGIEGPQTRRGRTVPAQMSLLQQVRDPDLVTVGVGANDAAWSIFLGVCYATECDAPEVRALLEGKFRTQLDLLTVANTDMLADLKAYRERQSSKPRVVIIGPYQPFDSAPCANTSRRRGQVLTPGEIAVLTRARIQLTGVLREGAEAHGFTYLEPSLSPLCRPEVPSLGPDIHPATSRYLFHPTAVGELKIALQVLAATNDSPAPSTPTVSPGTSPPGAP